jgi:hypothetical protein
MQVRRRIAQGKGMCECWGVGMLRVSNSGACEGNVLIRFDVA